MRFIVIDNTSPPMSGALDVEITVVATNQAPELAYIGPKLLNEGDTLIFAVTATDPDGTIPTLTAEGPSGNPLPGGASFIDNLDGTGETQALVGWCCIEPASVPANRTVQQ